MTKMNVLCFMVKNINIEIWQKTLDNVCTMDKVNSNINYIIISLKDHNKVIVGYIQYAANRDITKTDIINIIGSCKIDIWEEASIFQHLSLYETLMRAIVLHDA